MPPITAATYALIGITVVMALVALALLVSLARLARTSRSTASSNLDSTMMSSALQEAVMRLKAQERAMTARAEASERLSNQIISGVSSGLLVVDRDGIVQIVNPSARRILNLDAGGEGRPVTQLLAHVALLAQAITDTLESALPVARRRIRLDGKPSHLGVSVSPLTGADGRLQAVVCLFTDLTDVVELEDQLRLKEALASVGEMTAGLAHELRNGLATIHGYARLFDLTRVPDDHRPYVEGIRQETTAMGEVVTNFLNFARPEPLTLTPLDLRPLVERAVADQDAGGTTLPQPRIVVGGEFGEVLGDEVLLRQALSNLLRNSLEACAQAGIEPEVHVTGTTDAPYARLVIEDNGPGIPADALAKIFKPFVTTKAQGTGLGLSIVQKVIVSHNGRITAGNRADGGARFTIQLPLAHTTR